MFLPRRKSIFRYLNTGYKEWARAVKVRDGYKCRKCGVFSKSIHAHHIDNFHKDKKNKISVPNGICLCARCHTKFHQTYGYARNNKDQIQEFLRSDI